MKDTKKITRNLLSSVDLSDIIDLQNVELNPEEAMSRANDTEIFYKSHFEKVLKLIIQKQLEFMGSEAETMEQFMFARGTINGLSLVKDWCEEQVRLSRSKFDKDKKVGDELGEI